MIPLRFEKLSRYDRIAEPCTVAVPFPQGELPANAPVAVCDGDRPLPTQARVTAYWPDGSVRWLLVHFLADLPGNAGKTFHLRADAGKAPNPAFPVTVDATPGSCSLRTGDLDVVLAAHGQQGLFQWIRLADRVLARENLLGPTVYDAERRPWVVQVSEEGWEVIEAGPVRAVVQAKGKHCHGDDRWLDFTARVYAFAGKPWLRVDYQVMHREAEEKELTLQGMVLEYHPTPHAPVRTALATSNYASRIRESQTGEELRHVIDATQLLYEANEQIPEVLYGTFWADWCESNQGGLCLTLYQAHQNFPKALVVDRQRLQAWLLPSDQGSLTLIQGMAKTHRLFLHWHGPEVPLADLNVRSLQFQLPDRPTLDTATYQRAGGLDPIWVKQRIPDVERVLVDLADNRTRAYGILHWGDGPDAGYTHQGRGHGELVWTNMEYDLPHSALMLYTHIGERRMLDYLLVAAEHWMDVDVCHYSEDPLRHQGQIVHSARHATGGVTVSHEWVEGLLDYYHLTGERFAYETALGIGENVLRHLQRPALRRPAGASARETGWALRTLVALYWETGDERWMEPAEFIVEQFERWQKEFGAWLSPYTDHTLVRVPFMIAVAVNGLMRYHRVRPQPRVAQMILNAMRDLIEHCLTPDGRFYYKELPSTQRRGAGGLVLEALAHAYELSGDVKFLEAGLPTFRLLVQGHANGRGYSGPKYQAGDAVIWPGGPGPKSFAAMVPPMMYFYRALTEAGIPLNSLTA